MTSALTDFHESFILPLKPPDSQVPDSRVGTLIGFRYAIEGVLGEGGMAKVYQAKDIHTGETCAIKILSPIFARDELVRERFRREAKNAQKLAHPNVIQVMAEGETIDGSLFMAIELLEGEPLDRVLAHGPLPLARAMSILMQMSRAVARAHDYQIVHRDLKPENIFVVHKEDGLDCVKILDFGIAHSIQDVRLTNAGEVYGTPQYMAPERILSSEAGSPQDLYALGVLFFEILSAQLPFDADDLPSFLLKHLNEPPATLASKNIYVPHELEKLIQDLLAKDPLQRPIDAHQVHRELHLIAERYDLVKAPSVENASCSLQPKPLSRLLFTIQDQKTWASRCEFWQQTYEQYKTYERVQEPSFVASMECFNRALSDMKNIWIQYQATSQLLENFELHLCFERYQLGLTTDQMGNALSILRYEAHKLYEQVKMYEQAVQLACEIMHKIHREIVHWEGRSGLQTPSLELAMCYRKCADVIEEWARASVSHKDAFVDVQAKEQEIYERDMQMQNLIQDFERKWEQDRTYVEKNVLDAHAKLVKQDQELCEIHLVLRQKK